MTAATLHDDIAPHSGRARVALLGMTLLTALWIALNYAVPLIAASGAPTPISRLSIHVLIALGLWLGLERTELSAAQRRSTWLAVMIPFTLWLGIAWSAAINGEFRAGVSPIPLTPFAIFLPIIIGVPILLLSKRMGQLLDAMPASWLIALQAYRVLGSAFLIGWARGVVPGIFGLPAGIGDVLTGLLALPVALSLASASPGAHRRAAMWNVFGLLDFTVAISVGLAIAFKLIIPDIPNTTTGIYPTVLIPAFAVPSSILLHVLSLRQLWRRRAM
jgi:hypothetical protein